MKGQWKGPAGAPRMNSLKNDKDLAVKFENLSHRLAASPRAQTGAMDRTKHPC